MTNIKAANHPKRPNGSKDHRKTSIAGATPKATRSASESYSIPNLLVVPVNRAILPSRPSKMAEMIIATAADSYLPFIAAMMA